MKTVTAVVKVPFKVHVSGGLRTYYVECPYAPTLTASGYAIKHAGEVPMDYELRFCMDATGGNRAVSDMEAVVLQPDGSSQFIGIPPATM